jgi:hypothetical protein
LGNVPVAPCDTNAASWESAIVTQKGRARRETIRTWRDAAPQGAVRPIPIHVPTGEAAAAKSRYSDRGGLTLPNSWVGSGPRSGGEVRPTLDRVGTRPESVVKRRGRLDCESDSEAGGCW